MSGTFQNFTGLGRLGRDPETRYTEAGIAVTNFSMAFDMGYKDKSSGSWVDRTTWIRFVAFGPAGEAIGKYVRKGDRLLVTSSEFVPREFEQDGVKKYAYEFKVQRFTFVERKQDLGGSSAEPPNDYGPPPQDDFENDIPF